MKKKGTPLRVMTIYVVRQLQLAVGSAIEFVRKKKSHFAVAVACCFVCGVGWGV
jgi:hypothetical protein